MSGALWLLFRSLPVSLWSLAGGTLIDVDHLYDYARHRHRPPLARADIRHFFDIVGNGRLDRVFLILHSWEVVAAGLIGGALLPAAGAAIIPLSFGMAFHLLLDAAANGKAVLRYSLIARTARRFDGRFFYGR
ncbi:MAG: hypothetical protein PHN82_06795 [bacterium]|nr:hypothetical protein [bacterium]